MATPSLRPALVLVLVTFAGGMVGRCYGQQPYSSIMALINNRTDLTTLKAAITRANLTSFLSTATNTTALLPNDAAFAAFFASTNVTAADLLALDADVVADLLKYHILGVRTQIVTALQLGSLNLLPGNNMSIYTMLYGNSSKESTYPWARVTIAYNGSGSTAASLTVLGTSSSAKVLEIDISAGSGNAVSIIDGVLTYWYTSVQTALSAHADLTSFVTGLKTNAASLWTQLAAQTNITVFAPINAAVGTAKTKFDVDLAVMSDAAASIVNCHVAKGMRELPTPAQANSPTAPQFDSLLLGNRTLCTINANRNSSGLYLDSLGNSANIVNVKFIPVGAPWSPLARIHTVDGVALDTFSSVWQYISAYAGPGSTSRQLWASWLSTDSSISGQLSDPKLAAAVLVPTESGVNSLATSKGTTAANWLSQLTANGKKKTLFENHIVIPTITPAQLRSTNRTLNTYAGSAKITTMAANITITNTVIVQFAAEQTAGLLAPASPGFDPSVEIMFGRAYIYTITAPMVPSEVPLPASGSGGGNGGGAATTARPCAWLVLLLAALAAVLAAGGGPAVLRA
ncbi:hypothetical protein HXX76_016109 [Chlamydomonas incerta]|uniref:FAS1 domain-containing protein n=1 Tax=Chlamydomonas incerta TaxID=51695 RepID=A0A835S8N0_CHLIN|nr:hypothetical protein HXX76_016109 [Chlamydomonas incerta]|eukprot:KAG2422349.1 hypothetical protein HXX76_016109 [Chlamydomonas incerta]